MSVTHEDIYYLDPWFVAREYESRTSKSLPTSVSRSTSEGMEGDLLFVKAKGATSETVVFEQTPEKAFWEIFANLSEFELRQDIAEDTTRSIFWIDGLLTLFGRKSSERLGANNEKVILEEGWSFCLVVGEDSKSYIRLLSNQSFFRYNIDEFLSFPKTLGRHCKMKVRILMKSHADTFDGKAYVATPLVILSNNNG